MGNISLELSIGYDKFLILPHFWGVAVGGGHAGDRLRDLWEAAMLWEGAILWEATMRATR
jgi:hypothetical protein